MKVSFIHGICVRYDAISNAIADEIGWLREAGHEVRLYTSYCDRPQLPHILAQAIKEIVYDAHFQHSDLVIFHFGIYYPLFDLLPVAPRRARRIVVFHNITPKALAGPGQHAVIARSFEQIGNIMFADHVICDSDSNLQVLRAARITTPATVLPLAVRGGALPVVRKPGAGDGIVRLAFIGRLVPSKGPDDLLAALRYLLRRDGALRIALDIVANLAFSDAAVLARLRDAIDALPATFGNRVTLRLHGNADDTLKQRILSEADLFVLPTYHEGFCVPIVEALASGCKVVSYANSNVPAICGGLARLAPTGDIAALTAAIAETIGEINSPAWQAGGPGSFADFSARAWRYAQEYAPDTVKLRYTGLLDCLVRAHRQDAGARGPG
ncbi:MAG: glycosyltransferase family 4 protein [Pseudomonadota bacterium]